MKIYLISKAVITENAGVFYGEKFTKIGENDFRFCEDFKKMLKC